MTAKLEAGASFSTWVKGGAWKLQVRPLLLELSVLCSKSVAAANKNLLDIMAAVVLNALLTIKLVFFSAIKL